MIDVPGPFGAEYVFGDVEAEFHGGPNDGKMLRVRGMDVVLFPTWTGTYFINAYGEEQPAFGQCSYKRVESTGPRLQYEYQP